MTTYQINRWDAVIYGSNNHRSPMIYVKPDMYLLEFLKANQYSVFCEIKDSESVYDKIIVSGVANSSAYTPNCRPNYFADTNMYVITLEMDFKGYPPKNGNVVFSGYKNPKPQAKPTVAGPMPMPMPMPVSMPVSVDHDNIPVGFPVTQYCENGQTFQCASGTYGCTYNSSRFCPQIENHRKDSLENKVTSGPNTPEPTKTKNNSTGGSTRTSGGSTNRGTTTKYTPGRYGGEETHYCTLGPNKIDGKNSFTCQGGTKGCYDDSPDFCQITNKRREYHCKPPSTAVYDCTEKTDQECEDKYC